MKQNSNPNNERYLIVSISDMEDIKEKLTLILNNISQGKHQNNSTHSEFMDQKEAEKYLNKKTTWFWQMRKSGKLFFTKLGNKNYYRKTELDRLFNDS